MAIPSIRCLLIGPIQWNMAQPTDVPHHSRTAELQTESRQRPVSLMGIQSRAESGTGGSRACLDKLEGGVATYLVRSDGILLVAAHDDRNVALMKVIRGFDTRRLG